jgi:WD40 repeat protein
MAFRIKATRTFQPHPHTIQDARFSPDGTQLATCTHTEPVVIWNTQVTHSFMFDLYENWQRLYTFHDTTVHALSWHPTRSEIAGACTRQLQLWDTRNGLRTKCIQTASFSCIEWFQNGRMLACGDPYGLLVVLVSTTLSCHGCRNREGGCFAGTSSTQTTAGSSPYE